MKIYSFAPSSRAELPPLKKAADEFALYLHDESNYQGCAEGLFLPKTEEELSRILAFCQEKQHCCTIAANRTSLTGAAIAQGGYILSLEKLNASAPYEKDGIFIFSANHNYGEAQKFLLEQDLYLPVDPTSAPDCTLGGAVINNASGARSYKYGAIRHFVQSLKIVLINGEWLILKRGEVILTENESLVLEDSHGDQRELKKGNYPFAHNIKNTSGYYNEEQLDLIDLFIGSEGTLGVITEIGIKPIKKPKETMQMLIPAPSDEILLNLWESLKYNQDKQLNKQISALEFFDYKAYQLSEKDLIECPDSGGILWIEIENPDDDILENIIGLLEEQEIDIDHVFLAETKKDQQELKELRHAIPEKINGYIQHHHLQKIGLDYSVRPQYFRELFQLYRKSQQDSSFPVVIFGHIGDQNLHVNFIPDTPEEIDSTHSKIERFTQFVIQHNGTLSSEHGIGKKKHALLRLMYHEDAIQAMKRIKHFWDPQNLLNRGNLFKEDEKQ